MLTPRRGLVGEKSHCKWDCRDAEMGEMPLSCLLNGSADSGADDIRLRRAES